MIIRVRNPNLKVKMKLASRVEQIWLKNSNAVKKSIIFKQLVIWPDFACTCLEQLEHAGTH